MNDLIFEEKYRYLVNEDTEIRTDNSIIYRAQDIKLKRDVCLKLVNIKGDSSEAFKENLNKSLNEVRVMVRLGEKIDQIPTIYQVHADEQKKQLIIAMQWIKGKSLSSFIGNDNMRASEFEFIGWIESLCSILATMSEERTYHKDIKPDNIIINDKRELILMDFNISASLPNTVEGTIKYKAPEMETSKTVKRDKVDVFAIGVILYQYYTGVVPARGMEYGQKSRRHDNAEWDYYIAPAEKNKKISVKMNEIITKCMSKDYRRRYDIKQLLYDIRYYKRGLRDGNKNNRRTQKRNSDDRY